MVVQLVKSKFGKRFDEEIKFVRGMIEGPKQVGAILPTSSVTARVMASVIDDKSSLPVLELGPGTGAITRAILSHIPPERLVSVEYSTPFFLHLQKEFPGVNFLNGDAFELDTLLGTLKDQQFDCVISAIPMLNFPMQRRVWLVENLLARMPAGRPMVQISYGPISPVAAKPESYRIDHMNFVVRNIPPAQIWTYRRPC
jgi:phosphatidylethanolamine/phosphatidyl-N-methylethanolamine N-methyltransferase